MIKADDFYLFFSKNKCEPWNPKAIGLTCSLDGTWAGYNLWFRIEAAIRDDGNLFVFEMLVLDRNPPTLEMLVLDRNVWSGRACYSRPFCPSGGNRA